MRYYVLYKGRWHKAKRHDYDHVMFLNTLYAISSERVKERME